MPTYLFDRRPRRRPASERHDDLLKPVPSPWISVSDQEPPFGETILATDGQCIVFARYERGALGHPRKFVECGGWQFPGATHWMPIPDLPKTTEAA